MNGGQSPTRACLRTGGDAYMVFLIPMQFVFFLMPIDLTSAEYLRLSLIHVSIYLFIPLLLC